MEKLPVGAASMSVEDRRDALRETSLSHHIVIEHTQHGRHRALLVDVSRTGLRCKSDSFLPCGGLVTLHPPRDTELEPCRARIVRQSVLDELDEDGEAEEPGFEYGLRFTDLTSNARHAWFLVLRQRYAS